jgi:hypothetical protein
LSSGGRLLRVAACADHGGQSCQSTDRGQSLNLPHCFSSLGLYFQLPGRSGPHLYYFDHPQRMVHRLQITNRTHFVWFNESS